MEDGGAVVMGNLIHTSKNLGGGEKLERSAVTWVSPSLISPVEFLFMNEIWGALTCA